VVPDEGVVASLFRPRTALARGRRMWDTAERTAEILLVDDNPADVRLTVGALRTGPIPANLHVASDGIEALAFLRHEAGYGDAPRPDIILLDLNLPQKSGADVLAEIKADEDLRRIPVVVLTTSDADEDVRASYERSANCYVTKPVTLDQYAAVIQAIEAFWLLVAQLPRH
jgi:chemotaxis family two-component system response regulator Rcp1